MTNLVDMREPTDKIFTMDFTYRTGGQTFREVHRFAVPVDVPGKEPESGEELIENILAGKRPDGKESPKKRSQSQIRGTISKFTRNHYLCHPSGTCSPAIELYHANGTRKHFQYMLRNKLVNSSAGDYADQKFYDNDHPEEFLSFDKEHRNVNTADGNAAVLRWHKNHHPKEKIFQEALGYEGCVIKVNGPDDEFGHQIFFENGERKMGEYFYYDGKGERVDPPCGVVNKTLWYDDRKLHSVSWLKNGPGGYQQLDYDREGNITHVRYYLSDGTPVSVNDPKKIALLIDDKNGNPGVNKAFSENKEGIKLMQISRNLNQAQIDRGIAIKAAAGIQPE